MSQIGFPADRKRVALRRLVEQGVLSAAQADAVHAALAESQERRGPARWWAEIAGYVGGALMFGGAALLLGRAWDRLSDPARSGVLAGVTAALLAAALLIAGGSRGVRGLARGATPVRRRVVAVLFAAAAGTGAFAASVLTEQYAGVAGGAAGLVLAAAAYAALPALPALAVAAIMIMIFSAATLNAADADTPLNLGLAFVSVGVAWTVLAITQVLRPRPVALGIGTVITIIGAQQPLGSPGRAGWAYALTFGVALASFALYRSQRTVVLLVAGVVAVAIAAPEAVWDVTNGAASGAVILLVAGAALLAASALGLSMWRGGRAAGPAAGAAPGHPAR